MGAGRIQHSHSRHAAGNERLEPRGYCQPQQERIAETPDEASAGVGTAAPKQKPEHRTIDGSGAGACQEADVTASHTGKTPDRACDRTFNDWTDV